MPAESPIFTQDVPAQAVAPDVQPATPVDAPQENPEDAPQGEDDTPEVPDEPFLPVAPPVPQAPQPASVPAGHALTLPDRDVQIGSITVPFVALRNYQRYYDRKGTAIDTIVIHFTDGHTAAARQAAVNERDGKRRASFHLSVGKAGDYAGLVPLEYGAWQCSGKNFRGVGIECCAFEGEALTAAQGAALVRLVKTLMGLYSIPVERVEGHRWATKDGPGSTDCPGDLFGGSRKDVSAQRAAFLSWRLNLGAQAVA